MQGGEEAYKQQMKQVEKQQQEEMRQSILQQILTPEAKDRLIKIKLVKPEKVTMIENSLIQAAQQGKLRGKVSEQELITMLDSAPKTESKVTFKRRGIDDQW